MIVGGSVLTDFRSSRMTRIIEGLPTGFKALDDKLMGLKNGEVIVVASRPLVGKTTFAMNIAECLSLGCDIHGVPFSGRCAGRRPVLYFSLQMPSASFAKRLLYSRARVDSLWLERCEMPREAPKITALGEASNELQQALFYVEDTPGPDIEELCKKAKDMKHDHGIELVIVDYLQLCESNAMAQHGRQAELAHISAQLKVMAKELMVPVIVLAQLLKPVGRDALPNLSDLRDAAAIEETADVVMLLHRTPPYFGSATETNQKDFALLNISKNRNGETGEVRMPFSREFLRFDN